MDKIEKVLKKLSDKERDVIKALFLKLSTNKTKGLDITKLKGYADIYRLRKDRLRIIFRLGGSVIYLIKIDRRSDTTYNE
jgi:mRNA-degrading endonuclease RelE of RelBE toxin-antitoxin system